MVTAVAGASLVRKVALEGTGVSGVFLGLVWGFGLTGGVGLRAREEAGRLPLSTLSGRTAPVATDLEAVASIESAHPAPGRHSGNRRGADACTKAVT